MNVGLTTCDQWPPAAPYPHTSHEPAQQAASSGVSRKVCLLLGPATSRARVTAMGAPQAPDRLVHTQPCRRGGCPARIGIFLAMVLGPGWPLSAASPSRRGSVYRMSLVCLWARLCGVSALIASLSRQSLLAKLRLSRRERLGRGATRLDVDAASSETRSPERSHGSRGADWRIQPAGAIRGATPEWLLPLAVCVGKTRESSWLCCLVGNPVE